jgi:hypothetical protein
MRVPPTPKGRIFIRDPEWSCIDVWASNDPAEWLCLFTQCEVAALLGVSSRAIRYWEASGRTDFKVINGRKRYSLGEIRRLLTMRMTGQKFPSARMERLTLLNWAGEKLRSRIGE